MQTQLRPPFLDAIPQKEARRLVAGYYNKQGTVYTTECVFGVVYAGNDLVPGLRSADRITCVVAHAEGMLTTELVEQWRQENRFSTSTARDNGQYAGLAWRQIRRMRMADRIRNVEEVRNITDRTWKFPYSLGRVNVVEFDFLDVIEDELVKCEQENDALAAERATQLFSSGME